MARKRVVIVGGGFGGLRAATSLAGADVDVVLLDRRNHHLFQPLLYQVATASLAPSDIAEPLRVILARQANVAVRLAEVTDVDLESKAVLTTDGERIGYDWLIVAAGARTSYFGHDAWAAHAAGLKTIGDALAIRRQVLMALERADDTDDPELRKRLLTFVVVGAGPTGVEMAGSLREIALQSMPLDYHRLQPAALRVILVEAGPSVLPPFPASLQAKALASLERLGVEVRTGAAVEAIGEGHLVVAGEHIEASTIVWAAGVRGSPLGARLGVPVDRAGRVAVGPDCALPGRPEVFVIGDLASFSHGLERPLPGVAPVAVSMGAHAARAIHADLAGRPRPVLRYLDKGSLATIGKRLAVADLRGLRLSGTVAWILWVFVHLMTLVGFRNRAVVFVKWGWAWALSDRSSRLLWQDEVDR